MSDRDFHTLPADVKDGLDPETDSHSDSHSIGIQPELLREGYERFVMLLQYNGEPYEGSQVQRHPGRTAATVEEVLTDAFHRLNIPVAGRVIMGSRTDQGVHAWGMVAHVDVQPEVIRKMNRPFRAFNSHLPEAIRVLDTHWGSPDFDARRRTLCRWYRYRVLSSKVRPPLLPPDVWWTHRRFDGEKMDKAARLLEGEYDFNSFKQSASPMENTVCRLFQSRIVQESPDSLYFDVVANRFLYKMVRNIMGQLLAIGDTTKSLAPEIIVDVLNRRDRTAAAETAPSRGLCQMAMVYPSQWNYFCDDPRVTQLQAMLRKEPCGDENIFRKTPGS